MQSLSVQALTLRQLGRLTLSPRQLLLTTGPHRTEWCPKTLHCRQLWGSTSSLYHGTHKLLSVDPATSWSLHHSRFKSNQKKGGKKVVQQEEEEEDEEESDDSDVEEEDDPSLPKDYKDMEKYVQSFRYDVIMKAGLDMARNKVEDAFYSNMLRLNGQKLIKKSKSVKVGDTLDLIVNKDTDSVTLMRVVVRKTLGESRDGDKYKVALRRWKNLQLPAEDAFKN